MGMFCLFFGHKWNGCTCKRCGVKRDAQHAYQQIEDRCETRCAICGKIQSTEHAWNGCICARCSCISHDRILDENDLVRAIHIIDSKTSFLKDSDKKNIEYAIDKINRAELLSDLAFGDASLYVRTKTIIKAIKNCCINPTDEQLAGWSSEYLPNTELGGLARNMLHMRGLNMTSPYALYQLYAMTTDKELKKKIAQKLLSIGNVETLTRLAMHESMYEDSSNFERLVKLLPINSVLSVITSLADDKGFYRWLDIKEKQKHKYDAMINAVRIALSIIPDDDILINLYRSGNLMTGIKPEPLKFVKNEKKIVALLCSESAHHTAHLMRGIDFPVSQEGLKEIALTFAHKHEKNPYHYEIIHTIISKLDDTELAEHLKTAIYIDPSTIHTPFGDDHKD